MNSYETKRIYILLITALAAMAIVNCSSPVRSQVDAVADDVLDPDRGIDRQASLSKFDLQSMRAGDVRSGAVAEFFDRYFTEMLPSYHVPGAVVSVVKDEEIIFSKGYGYADIENDILYRPDETIFWAASIAKIFSVVGVLQLEEQGLIHLDDDVSPYLGNFQIPATYSQPITFWHLLTHTDGFEARIIGDAARKPEDLRPLSEVVRANLPSRITPPGRFLTYGNYGVNLAGLLIEEITGTPFSTYMREQIFGPLVMDKTTFEQVLPTSSAHNIAVGYGYGTAGYEPKPYVYVDSLPQGGGRSTAMDMAHFMIALLDEGQFNENRILEAQAAQSMFTQQFTAHPDLGGITYGLFEVFRNGQRLLIRDGDGWGFRSRMVILPEQNLGIFVHYNNEDADSLREDVLDAFMDNFFPATKQSQRPSADPPRLGLQDFTGIYRPIQADETTFFKIALLFAQHVRVTQSGEGEILVEPVGMGDSFGGFDRSSRWLEKAPLYFQSVDGQGDLAFGRDDLGEITYLFSGQKYHGTYRKLAWYETPQLHLFFLCISTAVFAVTPAIWLRDTRRKRKGNDSRISGSDRAAGWLAVTMCLLQLTFLAGLMVVMGRFVDIIYGVPCLLRAILILPLAAAGLMPVMVMYSVAAWKNGDGSVPRRIGFSLLVLLALFFLVWLQYWNLFGFQY